MTWGGLVFSIFACTAICRFPRCASWACRSDLWRTSKDNFQLCICMQLSVWATRQAFRFRGRSICISEGSRCCIIKSNLEGKEKVKKGQNPYPTTSESFVPQLSPFWGSWVLFRSQATAPGAIGPILIAWWASKKAAIRGVSYGIPGATKSSCCHGRDHIVSGWSRMGPQRNFQIYSPEVRKCDAVWGSRSLESETSKDHSQWGSSPWLPYRGNVHLWNYEHNFI